MLSRFALFMLAALVLGSALSAEEPRHRQASLRGPASLAVTGGFLWVGNEKSGTISQVSLDGSHVVAEHAYGDGLVAVYPHADGGLWVLDDARHALVRVQLKSGKLARQTVAAVASHPRRLVLLKPKKKALVSSRWGRAVTVLEFSPDGEEAATAKRIELSFAPGELVVLDQQRELILVADAFGGKLSVIDAKAAKRLHTFSLPIQSIRGASLTAKGDEVVFTHQLLDPKIWGERDSVHWGLLMANSLRGVRVSDLLNPQADLMRRSWLDAIGAVGEGAGDPGTVLVDQGRTMVAIAGVNQVLVDAHSYRQRFRVGRGPAALAVSKDTLFVANRFDDSVTCIDLKSANVVREIKLGPQRELAAAERGERLFYDARLSLAGWMSCNSCHTDGHSTATLADTLGDGGYGASKRVLSLRGVRETGPWGWTASAKSLAEQVRKSVRTTMHGRPINDAQVADIVAFLQQLTPPPAAKPQRTELVERGRKVFAAQNCSDCHKAPYYTTPDAYDVQLTDKSGNREFNPPSLRGLNQRDGFFHDRRFDNLRDVFRKAKHQLDKPLSKDDEAALLAFLRSL